MGRMIVLGIFAYCVVQVIKQELIDIILEDALRRLPR